LCRCVCVCVRVCACVCVCVYVCAWSFKSHARNMKSIPPIRQKTSKKVRSKTPKKRKAGEDYGLSRPTSRSHCITYEHVLSGSPFQTKILTLGQVRLWVPRSGAVVVRGGRPRTRLNQRTPRMKIELLLRRMQEFARVLLTNLSKMLHGSSFR
jgi:hypothetical protein